MSGLAVNSVINYEFVQLSNTPVRSELHQIKTYQNVDSSDERFQRYRPVASSETMSLVGSTVLHGAVFAVVHQ